MLDEALIGVVLLDLRLVHSTELQFRARALHWQRSQRTNPLQWKVPVKSTRVHNSSSVQFSSATHARCGGTFNVRLTTNLPRNLLVKNFFESVKIWQNYGRESVAPLFGAPCRLQCVQTLQNWAVYRTCGWRRVSRCSGPGTTHDAPVDISPAGYEPLRPLTVLW